MYAQPVMNTRNPLNAYAKVAIDNTVETANPHKLILMLFDGAMLAVANGRAQMERGEIAEKGQSISKAINIITNGLKASLDQERGADLAERLAALYDYMELRLVHANLRNDPAVLQEVHGLLGELRSAWAEIANDPAVLSANATGV